MIDRIRGVLSAEFGIDCDNITKTTGGWSSLAYKAVSQDRTYFLKAYEKKNESLTYVSSPMDVYIPVLRWLNSSTALCGSIVNPVFTVNGSYKGEDELFIYLLFDFIDGEVVGDRKLSVLQVRELAQIVALLHMYGSEIPVNTAQIKEEFDLTFHNDVKAFYADTQWEKLTDIRDAVSHYRRDVLLRLDEINAVAAKLKTADIHMRLCHRDIHGGNLIISPKLILVDGEDMKLAPVEADLNVFAAKPYWEEFYSCYKQFHPGFSINDEILGFYVLSRILSVIRYFLGRFMYDSMTAEECVLAKKYMLDEFRNLESFHW